MRKLILIKHARPQVDEGVPSHEWGLSDEGRQACRRLAGAVRGHDPAAIITSREPKARETGRLLGEAMGKPVTESAGLEEHDRSNVPMMPPNRFISMMALFFKQRDRLVLGRETADQAARRFHTAIDSVLAAHSAGNVAVVTHGTVLALFVAEHGAADPFVLWREMGLPSLCVLQIPGFAALEMIKRIDDFPQR